MEEAPSVLKSWLTKVKVPPGLRVFIGIGIITSFYILNPGAPPVLVVPNSELHLQVPVFRQLLIQFTQPQHVKSCILGRPEVCTRVSLASLTTGSEQSVDGDAVTNLTLVNCYTNGTGPDRMMLQPIKISVSSDHMRIASVSIDNRAVPLEAFLKTHVIQTRIRTPAYISQHRFFRDALASKVSDLNEPISNWALTFMFFGISWVVVRLLALEAQVFLYPRHFLIRTIQRASRERDLSSHAARERAGEWCKNVWSQRDAMYRYLQALGPAAGFLMTVTSLIYSLSSSKVDVQLLIGGMHIAMVSTFLGLTLRIIALEGERASVSLLAREISEIARVGKNPEITPSGQ
jgi:hypothetical protein